MYKNNGVYRRYSESFKLKILSELSTKYIKEKHKRNDISSFLKAPFAFLTSFNYAIETLTYNIISLYLPTNKNIKNMNRLIILLFFISNFAILANSQEDTYSAFSTGKGKQWMLYKHNNEALYSIITDEALDLLDGRKEKIDKLQTKEEWLSYRDKIKKTFRASLDKFEKTPLNARITGKIKKDGFTVEKIIFESHPGFYVTGCLFVPKKRQKPAPTVIYVSGHSDIAFRSETYQKVILNLVGKGFVVFAYDPIGQGERLQYLNTETGKSDIGGPTTEHSYAGAQALLTGTSLSDYFIWDGVRAIDYLATRKEVDIDRIGITGRSGGGTQSAMISAYDDRVYAAAPECYITNFTRLLQSIGPQDAEQNPYGFIKNGMDHPDFIHLRAPKPTLIVTTTHDFFSQQGARETFAEAKKSYAALGMANNIQITEDMGGHESTKKNRETVYAFFQKALNNPGDNTDNDVETFSVEELWVTPTGQLGSSFKGNSVFDLTREYFSEKKIDKKDLRNVIKENAGIEFDRKFSSAVFTGKITGDNHIVKKYFIENNKKDFAFPFYEISNGASESGKILIWLNPEGKEKTLESDLLPHLLKSGYTVISADLPGIGELYDPDFKGDGFVKKVPFNYTFGANLVGKSITGIRTEALDLIIQYIEKEFDGAKTDILAEGGLGEVSLHCAVLKNPFSKIVLSNLPESNRELITERYYDPKLAYNVVPGSLVYYDLQDLTKLLPNGSVKIFSPVNALGEQTGQESDSPDILKFLQ